MVKEINIKDLPKEYLNYIAENKDGGQYWFKEYDDEEVLYLWSLHPVEVVKKNIKEKTISNWVDYTLDYCSESYIEADVEGHDVELNPERLRKGIIIGGSKEKFLYLDPSDNHSVWAFYHVSCDVCLFAKTFKDWFKKVEQVKNEFKEHSKDIRKPITRRWN